MHAGMWEHPATRANVETLTTRGARFVGPTTGALAFGDEGIGRLVEPEAILAAAEDVAARGHDLAGRRIVVTAGPTHEPIDPVRFLGNRSSGRMGFAVAAEAHARGADVVVIAGPTSATPPEGPRFVRIETAAELRDAVLAEIAEADAVVMAAAVADFRVAAPSPSKRKKDSGVPSLALEPTVDVLAELGARADRPILIGFAAETDDVETEGRRKLAAKGADVVIANRVGAPGTGFGEETDDAAILAADGSDEPMRRWTKAALAVAICDRLVKLLAG
jgi:phosphopantothenoylcysteine decarboxylase/phosphopantothenate--cysteine ligase